MTDNLKKETMGAKAVEQRTHSSMSYSDAKIAYERLIKEVKKAIIGQDEVIEQLVISILADNHALLEGFPGLGKTATVMTLSKILDLRFSRIQCTPDLMPSDITGTYVIEEDASSGKKSFRFQGGPVFANIVLADEINRTTPKTQSALLEAMQERQVTVGNKTYRLELPFFVLATQNPIEMEGTYVLPEAQLDRFMLKIMVSYPSKADESEMVNLYTSERSPSIAKVMDREKLLGLQMLTRKMPVSDDVRSYALNIISKTRPNADNKTATEFLQYGASPRAAIMLVLAAKARALIRGNNYVSKKDIDVMAYPVLRHRLILDFESERRGVTTDSVIGRILKEAG